MTDPETVQTIKQIFTRRFAYWDIVLPVTNPPEPGRKSLYDRGRTIIYQFGTD